MCDVRPFRGLRYNLQQVTSLSKVITPPYDVIPPQDRARYYERSPHNIIRLEFGEEQPNDTPESNKYTRAAATLNAWLRDGFLLREEKPALYVVEHRFVHRDVETGRCELLARVRLEDFDTGWIRPHERTTRAPALDRLNLLRSCRANISPIMGMFRSEKGEMAALLRELSAGVSRTSATDDDGVTYSLAVVTDEAAIAGISALLADRPIYIADGHHRYETALHYREERWAADPAHTGDEPFNFVMMALMDSQDPGLVMLPTHRLVRGVEPGRVEQLLEAISPYFKIEELLPSLQRPADTVESWLHTLEMLRPSGTFLGLYGLHGESCCLLGLRPNADLGGLLKEQEARLWGDLDVVLLQRVILQGALGIDTEQEARTVEYARDGLEAKERVDSGKHQLAFFLNPFPVSKIVDTADAGERLPRKSTYFFPKTPAGLVINPIGDQD